MLSFPKLTSKSDFDNIEKMFWEESYDLFKEYVKKYGHTKIHKLYVTPCGYNLGIWAKNQRSRKDLNLTGHQIDALERLPGWCWNITEERWQRTFERLKQYVEVHGNAKIRFDLVTDDGFPLGIWVQTQRKKYRSGTMDEDKVEDLEELEGWSWNIFNDAWEENIEKVREYVGINDCIPNSTYERQKGVDLFIWVSEQRKEFKANTLSSERIEQLEAIPHWSWDVPSDTWEAYFLQLCEFSKKNKHANPPRYFKKCLPRKVEDPLALWIKTQRNEYRDREISQYRIEKLESVEGWTWDVLKTRWENWFSLLEEYVEGHGNAIVPRKYETREGKRLGEWVSTQRKNFRNDKLSDERVERLEALPHWAWDASEYSCFNQIF